MNFTRNGMIRVGRHVLAGLASLGALHTAMHGRTHPELLGFVAAAAHADEAMASDESLGQDAESALNVEPKAPLEALQDDVHADLRQRLGKELAATLAAAEPRGAELSLASRAK